MKTALKKSLVLHLAVFVLCLIDFPLFWFQRTTPSQVPIIVDLKDVKISEMTNLPPKAKMGEEDKAASVVKRKIEEKYTKDTDKAEPTPQKSKQQEETVEKQEAPKPVKKDFLVAPQPKKPVQKKVQEPKKAPKPTKKPDTRHGSGFRNCYQRTVGGGKRR